MPWRVGWLAATATCALLIVASCGRDAPKIGPLAGRTIVFSLSVAEDERAAVQTLLQRFTQATGAQVTLVSVAAEDLPQKLAVEVAAGRPSIDLFAQDTLLLRPLVDGRVVDDLSDVPIPQETIPILIPETFSGRRYFLPFRANVQVTYLNRRRFAQAHAVPPTTVQQLRDAAEKLKAAGDGMARVTLSLAQGGAAAVTLAEWIVAFGGNPLVLNDRGSVQAFEFLRDLWRRGLLARESLIAKFDTQVDFLVGETSWIAQNWPFTSGVLAEQGLLDFFGVTPGWRGPVRAAHVIGGDALGMPRGIPPARRDAARSLAQFLMSRETQQALLEANGWPAVRSDAYGAVRAELRGTVAAIEAALRDGWVRPSVPYWRDVSDALNEAVRRVLERGEPVPAALNALHRQVAAAAQRAGASYPP